MQSPFVQATSAEWVPMADGIRRRVLGHGTDLMIVHVEFATGAVGPLHKHPHRQASYIVSGVFDVTVGDNTKTLGAGDAFYPAGDELHAVKAIEGGILLDVFTPIREDFLPPA